uniref:U14-Liphistoxin-Lth1a_1 n=1 Tax=Liphistius thaleban TaxID=1905330 RepID=A0A4Q8K4Z0_9ARAC
MAIKQTVLIFTLGIYVTCLGICSSVGVRKDVSIQTVTHVHVQDWTDYGCQCINYSCGCCAHLDIPKIGLNDTACVNLSYLPKEYGISFTIKIDNLTIYNETISARNPPPVCFGAPILKEYADLCIKFYDLNVTLHKAHGCVELEARLHEIIVGTYKIGCFNVGHINYKIAHVKKAKTSKSTYIPKQFIVKLV